MRIAILPAGGTGSRMAKYQTPKQLLTLKDGLVIDYALEAARLCGAWPHVILPPAEERISRYVASWGRGGSFSYALPNLLQSVYELKKPFGHDQIIYIMPDTVFKPLVVCDRMLMKLDFPVIVGIVKTPTPQKLGMCVLTPESEGPRKVIGLADKPIKWDREPAAWALIAWRDPFWECIAKTKGDNMTLVIEEAVRQFGPLPAVWLNDFIDIGTPEDYERARKGGW